MRHAIKWLLAFPLLLAVLLGSTYTITNTFTSGTTAVASQVNANFSAAKTAIDDNDARLDALLATDTCTTPPCALTAGTTLNGSTIAVSGGALGAATATTPSVNDDSTRVATTAFVQAESVAAGDVTGSIGSGLTIGAGVVEASMVAADVATQAELDAKSAASSTDNAVARFDSTAGDVQNSGVTIDDSNNLTVPGDVTGGTSGAFCLIIRDSDDAGNSACEVLNGTWSCETDTNDTCGDAT